MEFLDPSVKILENSAESPEAIGKSLFSITLAHSAAQRAREVERLRAVTSSGARVCVIQVGDTVENLLTDVAGKLQVDPTLLSQFVAVQPQASLLLRAYQHLMDAQSAAIVTRNGPMDPETVIAKLTSRVRAARSRRDDAREDLAVLEDDLRSAASRERMSLLEAERERRSQLAESLGHARQVNRRRQELLQRHAILRSGIPEGLEVGTLSGLLEGYRHSVELLGRAKSAYDSSESMFPLGRGPDWTGALDDAVLKTVATEVENLIAELEALAQVAGQVQAEQNAIAGPPLEEAHLEEMAQQLTTQPAAGLEALDRSDEAPDTVEVLKAEEAKLRLELDRHTQFLSLAIGLAVLTVAAGVVVLLGGNTELGLAFLIVGPLACGGWAASISSVRSRTKREISEIVRRRVFESNRMKSASAEKAGPSERSEYSKLPAVAERVRALQQARKETAQKRLKVRAEHATWTKKFLEVHEVVRKRLGSPPDIFSSANVKAWLQESRQILDTLEAETVRRERNAQLVADRRNRDAALAQFALARKALTTALGSEADALSNEELEEHAGKLLADCSEILAVESALERAVEIPEAPLVERLAAVESRIQSLEALIGHGEDGTTLSLDPETLSELDRVRLSDARQRAEEATTDHDRLQAALDHVTFAIQQRSIALEYLVGAVREACEQFRDRISGLFADFVEHLWRDGHLGSDAPHECPSLDESLRVSGTVPDHLRSAVELLRQTALAVQCSGPIRLVYPEPLADADNPTYLAWMSALSSHAPAAGVTSITILTCQPWRVDALRSLAPDLFLSIPVRRLDE